MSNPLIPFISSPLSLIPKHNGGFQHIHHLSHPKGRSINNHISDKEGELRYIKFQEVLNLILKARRNCIIIKRDIKDAFQNIPITP